MSWLSNFFRRETVEVGIEAETDEQSLQRGIEALDAYAKKNDLEEYREKEFYCGVCGWLAISQYREHMSKH